MSVDYKTNKQTNRELNPRDVLVTIKEDAIWLQHSTLSTTFNDKTS